MGGSSYLYITVVYLVSEKAKEYRGGLTGELANTNFPPLSSIIKNFFRAETKNARPYFHSVMLSVKTCCISDLLPTSLAHSLTLSNSFQLPQFSSQAEMLKCVKMRTPLDFVNGSD